MTKQRVLGIKRTRLEALVPYRHHSIKQDQEKVDLNILIIVFGFCVGSFLNVCIYRIPLGLSVIATRSHCPHCKRPLRWLQNVPLVSYVFLCGKCRFCGHQISWQYPLIEVLTATACYLLYLEYGLSVKFGLYAAVTGFLIVIAGIDANVLRIPNHLVLTLLIGGVIRIMMASAVLASALLGAIAGAASLLLLAGFGWLLFRRESIGMGDVKFAAALGFWLGPSAVLTTIGTAILLGGGVGAVGLISGKLRRDSHLPFGTFLSVAAFSTLLHGDQIESVLLSFILAPWR